MTATNPPRRSLTIDNVKGVAIILVVFAHVTLGLNKTGLVSDSFIYQSMPLYLWYMAVFFFATGLFIETSLKRDGATLFLCKKAIELGYPFVIWSFIFGMTQMVFSSYTNTGAVPFSEVLRGLLPWEPRDHMWFLPSLFVSLAISALCYKLARHHWKTVLLIVSAAMAALVAFLPSWNQFLQYTLWVAVAVLVATSPVGQWVKGASLRLRSLLVVVVSVTAFLVIAVFWVGPGRSFYDDVPSLVAASGMGILAVTAFSRITAAGTWFGDQLAMVGRWSLHIYLTHVPVLAAVRVGMTRVLGIDSGPFITTVSVVICLGVGCLFGVLADRGFLSLLFRPPASIMRKLSGGKKEATQVV